MLSPSYNGENMNFCKGCEPGPVVTLKATGKIPEELNDTFVVTEYQATDGLRYILDWA
jgi:hypothetical protein